MKKIAYTFLSNIVVGLTLAALVNVSPQLAPSIIGSAERGLDLLPFCDGGWPEETDACDSPWGTSASNQCEFIGCSQVGAGANNPPGRSCGNGIGYSGLSDWRIVAPTPENLWVWLNDPNVVEYCTIPVFCELGNSQLSYDCELTIHGVGSPSTWQTGECIWQDPEDQTNEDQDGFCRPCEQRDATPAEQILIATQTRFRNNPYISFECEELILLPE